jgi:hypothetical protein
MSVCLVATRRLAFSVATVASLAGCAAPPMGPTVQVMPGPGKTFDTFQADNATCKGFAQQQLQRQVDASNQRAVGAGAAIGASNNSGDQQNIQAQYDIAFSQCMYAKGEQVPGYAPPRIAYVPPPAPRPNPLIRATQSELIRLGYLQGTADGFTGPKTRRAISSYEQANGLPVDGGASSRLLAKLQATPSNATAATAPAPTAWVAPTRSPGTTPASASASASAASSWIPPTRSP